MARRERSRARQAQSRDSQSGTAMEVGAMGEYLDIRVHDLVALDEIELYAEVLSAVAASDRPLTLAELDDALGVAPSAAAPVGAWLSSSGGG